LRARWNKPRTLWGFRPGTLLFYTILTLLSLTVILFLVVTGSRPRRTALETGARLEVLLDAGHGGMDGGAVSPEGVCEAPITLSVSRRTQLLLGFAGVSAGMVREDESSLDFSPEASPRQNKNADLNARLALARSHPECPFLSIHLNQFSQPVYSGAQVFYSPNHPKSVPLAETLQKTLRQALDPGNDRQIKPAPEYHRSRRHHRMRLSLQSGGMRPAAAGDLSDKNRPGHRLWLFGKQRIKNYGKGKDGICLLVLRLRFPEMVWKMPLLRQLEHHGGDGPAGG